MERKYKALSIALLRPKQRLMPSNSSITKLIINKTATKFIANQLTWMDHLLIRSAVPLAPSNISRHRPTPKIIISLTYMHYQRKIYCIPPLQAKKYNSQRLRASPHRKPNSCHSNSRFNNKFRSKKPIIKRCTRIFAIISKIK